MKIQRDFVGFITAVEHESDYTAMHHLAESMEEDASGRDHGVHEFPDRAVDRALITFNNATPVRVKVTIIVEAV
jgi:hypothetical protein